MEDIDTTEGVSKQAVDRAVLWAVREEKHGITKPIILKRVQTEYLWAKDAPLDVEESVAALEAQGRIKKVNDQEGQPEEWIAVDPKVVPRRFMRFMAGVILNPGDVLLTDFEGQAAALRWYKAVVYVSAVLELALHVVLMVLTFNVWRDMYNVWVFFVPYLFTFWTLMRVFFNTRSWAPEEFHPQNLLLGLAWNPGRATRILDNRTLERGTDGKRLFSLKPPVISKWLGMTYIVFIVHGVGFIRTASLMGQVDIHGGGPVCKSSCRRSYGDDQNYNPNGYFPSGSLELLDTEFATGYTGCVLHARWGGSNDIVPVIGQNLTEEDTPTVLYMLAGISQATYYPNPAFGMPEMSTAATIKDATRVEQCAGVRAETPLAQDLIDCGLTQPALNLPFRGRKICPVCLGYWRDLTGVEGSNGPIGYEHCDTSAGQGRTPLCYFCPGLGEASISPYMGWESVQAARVTDDESAALDEQSVFLDGDVEKGGRITFGSLSRVIKEEFTWYLVVLLVPWARMFFLGAVYLGLRADGKVHSE